MIVLGYIIMADKEKESTQPPKTYTYQDLIRFSSTQAYSSVGPNPLSNIKCNPHYSFGTGTRDAEPKKFISKEMAKVDCYGKNTPQGPNYNVTDKYAYRKQPEWKMGTQERNTLDIKAKYEHYFRKDIDVPP